MLRRSVIALALILGLPLAASADSFTAFGPHLGFSQEIGRAHV